MGGGDCAYNNYYYYVLPKCFGPNHVSTLFDIVRWDYNQSQNLGVWNGGRKSDAPFPDDVSNGTLYMTVYMM